MKWKEFNNGIRKGIHCHFDWFSFVIIEQEDGWKWILNDFIEHPIEEGKAHSKDHAINQITVSYEKNRFLMDPYRISFMRKKG